MISNKLKMFNFDISDKLKLRIRKLLKKDNKKVVIINKKIREISILPVRSKILFIFLVLLLALIITCCVNHRKEAGC